MYGMPKFKIIRREQIQYRESSSHMSPIFYRIQVSWSVMALFFQHFNVEQRKLRQEAPNETWRVLKFPSFPVCLTIQLTLFRWLDYS